MKVAAYVRVSTDQQAEHGLGLDIQRAAIRNWAKENGHKIARWFAEKPMSGSGGFDHSNGLTSRPQLASAFACMEAGQADALVVYRLDRLSRKVGHQEVWIERMESIGHQVISVTEPGYGGDEMRNLVRQILGSVAEYERVVIVKRLQAGRAAKAEAGGFAYGSPPFGWQSVNGELEPVAAEQSAIQRMQELRGLGWSLRRIADELNASGTPAKRAGSKWYAIGVARALGRAENS